MSHLAGRYRRRFRSAWPGVRRAGLAAVTAVAFAALLASPAAPARAAVPAQQAAARAAAPAASPGWSVRASYPNPVTGLAGIACPAETTCYSVGTVGLAFNTYGAAVKTSDGSTWATQSLPIPRSGKPAVDLAGVACPSPSTCFAVGARGSNFPGPVVMATTDGGSHWSSQIGAAGPGVSSLAAVACPSASTCYAVGAGSTGGGTAGAVVTTTDGGANWGGELLSQTTALNGVACPSANVCFAVGSNATATGGQVLVTTDGGATWISKKVPPSVVATTWPPPTA